MRFIESSQKDWLSKIDDESRESFVNTLFSVFEATGMYTFGEIKGQKLKAFERMYDSLKEIPKERQAEFMAIIGGLLQSGSHVARDAISDKLKPGD